MHYSPLLKGIAVALLTHIALLYAKSTTFETRTRTTANLSLITEAPSTDQLAERQAPTSTLDASQLAAISSEVISSICALSPTDRATFDDSGATGILDQWLRTNGTSEYLA